ncbi:MAG: hypothetical protein IH867_13610 [Chloroflexi bacterium]|nr:hypothetical protein [Chloroflexota bacterium]
MTLEELQQKTQFILTTLGAKSKLLVPLEINGTYALDSITGLHEILEVISEQDGFDRHLTTLTSGQERSWMFASRVAKYLSEKSEKLELEPVTASGEGNPDQLVMTSTNQVFVECKTIATAQFDNFEDHKRISDLIHAEVPTPHQLTVGYSVTPTDDEIRSLCSSINGMLGSLSTDGNIVNNEPFVVNVVLREGYRATGISVRFDMIIEDIRTGDRSPGHGFGKNGRTVVVHGPDVDYKAVLIDRVRDARDQYVPGQMFIPVICADPVLGDPTVNIRAIESIFQPDRNTRYSAVALISTHEIAENKSASLIRNPYAQIPTTNEIENLFQRRPA